MVSLIYRLNQSKVYIWSDFCNFVDDWLPTYRYAMTLLLQQAKRVLWLNLFFWSEMTTPTVMFAASHMEFVWGKNLFNVPIEFSENTQNATNSNQRNNRKQGKYENVVSLIFCFCFVSYEINMFTSVLILNVL